MKDAKLRSYYGISLEERDAMEARQGGVCAICGSGPTANRPLMVDHDHETGLVRALLCVNCNRNVGVVESETYLAILKYLGHHGSPAVAHGFDAAPVRGSEVAA